LTYCITAAFRTLELLRPYRNTPSSPASLTGINKRDGILSMKLEDSRLFKGMLADMIAVWFFESL